MGAGEKPAKGIKGTTEVVVVVSISWTWQLAIGRPITLVIVPLQEVTVATTKSTAAFTYAAA